MMSHKDIEGCLTLLTSMLMCKLNTSQQVTIGSSNTHTLIFSILNNACFFLSTNSSISYGYLKKKVTKIILKEFFDILTHACLEEMPK